MVQRRNYSIYDGIMKAVLSMYLEYYQIKQDYDLSDYRDYRTAVDAIRKASEIEISRNGFLVLSQGKALNSFIQRCNFLG